MKQGQTCFHNNLNWCPLGCFDENHTENYLVTLDITVKAKSREDAFAQIEKILASQTFVLYDAEAVEQSVQPTPEDVEAQANIDFIRNFVGLPKSGG